MDWKVFFVFGCSVCLANSVPGYYSPPRSSSVWGYFSSPLTYRVPSKTAMEAMVDLTNNLGVAILQDHSYSRGNFAFSPYGVASVLVVLYEGSRGESARQIHTAVGFPPDKDTIRKGFRDIHHHLRSYFSHEGYLSGISLNKDGSSLKPEYKKILKFYGYDIDLSQSPADDPGHERPTSQSPPVYTPKKTTVSSTVSEHPISVVTSFEPSTEEEKNERETTVQPAVTENILQQSKNSSQNGVEEPKTTTSFASKNSSQNGVEEPKTTTSFASKNSSQNGVEEPKTTTSFASTTTPNSFEVTTKFLNSTEPEETNITTTLSTTAEFEEEKTSSVSTTVTTSDDELHLNSIENYTSENSVTENNAQQQEKNKDEDDTGGDEKQNEDSSEQMLSEDQETSSHPGIDSSESSSENPGLESETQGKGTDAVIGLDNGMLIPQMGDTETTTTERFSATTDIEETSSLATDTTTQISQESTRNDSAGKDTLIQKEILAENKIKLIHGEGDHSKRVRSIINQKVRLWLGGNMKNSNSRIRRTLTDYLKSPHNPDLSLQFQNGMYDSHISRNEDLYRSLPRLLFLVDGTVDTPVPMMTYTNVFPYAYIPRLHAKALEFPLDDVRYKLLILLPVERRGLRQLIYDLGYFSLSNVLRAVQPTRVKAVVPTFMVEGFVILTSSLQNLGIWDVFDPRKANLSAMSLDPELYVRNVEQSVTVVIKNYVEILDIRTRTMAARQMEYEFEATHPFLYFVLDSATDIALMAGQILDPLNSRIY